MQEQPLPEGWEFLTLENCVEAIIDYRGKTPKKSILGIPLITTKLIKNGHITTPDEYILPEDYDEWMRRGIPQKGDVVFTTEGPLGEVAQLDGSKIALAQRIITLRGNPKILDNEYLKWLLRSEFVQKQLKPKSTGSTVTGIRQSELRKIVLLIPPLPIQHQIVALLEQAEAMKRQRQEADALTGALLHSVFFEMFGDPVRNEKGWPLKNIKEFSIPGKNAIKAGPFGSSLKKECYTKTGFKIYGQEQVIKDDLQFGNYYISQEKYEELINYSVQASDILISLVGSYGKISIVPESFEQGIINPRLMKISLNKELVLPIFFKHLFLTDGILNQVEELSHGGTMDIINVGIVKQLKFPIPPLALQQQFARIVQDVERIREQQVASGRQIEGLCDGLMQRAFAKDLIA